MVVSKERETEKEKKREREREREREKRLSESERGTLGLIYCRRRRRTYIRLVVYSPSSNHHDSLSRQKSISFSKE
jgi:hypothetical protein